MISIIDRQDLLAPYKGYMSYAQMTVDGEYQYFGHSME